MLGRIQRIEQLYILNKLPENKIYCDTKAKDQLDELKKRSINNNPPLWEQTLNNAIKIFTLNIASLRGKIYDLQSDPILKFANLAILTETHLYSNQPTEDLQVDGFQLHTNSEGKGKGVAVYFKKDMFTLEYEYAQSDLQITTLSSSELTVIAVYRSLGNNNLVELLPEIIKRNINENCIISGDLNLCPRREPNHPFFIMMRDLGFR